ncbi:GNAT family N-acetyltransferase, partial [Streptomyces sp. NRRL WC-3549]|uniref:GNAT family N-acetyltransferase n=1 Tax=Streptomyces sp. NRRL WC-3549 TaxID=1463925 RepID=UPI00131DA7AB
MTVTVRDFLPADAEDFVRVRRLALPSLVTTPEQVLRDLAGARPGQRYRLLVAEEDGEVTGTAKVRLSHGGPEPGRGFCNVYTDPARVGRGAGSLLVARAEEHLAGAGARTVHTWVLDEPANRAFAEKRGYAPRRPAHYLHLDLTSGG